MLKQILPIGIFIAFVCSPISHDKWESLAIWNVGQGQWVTFRDSQYCLHFDAGGEKAPLRKIMIHCEGRKNILFLSHDDFDHIRYTPWLVEKLHSCWFIQEPQKKFFKRLKTKIPPCSEDINLVFNVYAPKQLLKNTNEQSFVYAHAEALFPGDASRNSEKLWLKNPMLKKIRVLMLGHHGSKTSSSEELLKNLSSVKTAIASARRSRYGHPHFETLLRLRHHRIPVLSTEDWGNIQIF